MALVAIIGDSVQVLFRVFLKILYGIGCILLGFCPAFCGFCQMRLALTDVAVKVFGKLQHLPCLSSAILIAYPLLVIINMNICCLNFLCYPAAGPEG